MIRLAQTTDLDAIDALAVKTIEAMHKNHHGQWTLDYPRKPHFLADINQQGLYVMVEDNVIRGVMAVFEENEQSYTAVDWKHTHALVVHRLLVDPRSQGKGVADRLMSHVITLAKANGFDAIKIDTHTANTPMKNLLKKHLFTYRGYLPAIDRIAFEREIHYHTMRKITILGSPGTGKTTLARILGQKRDLTVMHLDQTYWQKDWQAMPPKPFNDAVRTFITSHSRYVVDGNYTNHRSFDERIGLSDTIILLDYPQKTALKGIIKREAQYKNRARSDMASGCLEGLDQEFLQYTAFFSTKKQQLQGFLNTIKHKKRVLVFPSRDALELWLANL